MKISLLNKNAIQQFPIKEPFVGGGPVTLVNAGGEDTTDWADPTGFNIPLSNCGASGTTDWNQVAPGAKQGTGYSGLDGEGDWDNLTNVVSDATLAVQSGGNFSGNYLNVQGVGNNSGIHLVFNTPIVLEPNTEYEIGLELEVVEGLTPYFYLRSGDNATITTFYAQTTEYGTRVYKFNSGSHTSLAELWITRNWGTTGINQFNVDKVYVRKAEIINDITVTGPVYYKVEYNSIMGSDAFFMTINSGLAAGQGLKPEAFSGLTIDNTYYIAFDAVSVYNFNVDFYIDISDDGVTYTQLKAHKINVNQKIACVIPFTATSETMYINFRPYPAYAYSLYLDNIRVNDGAILDNVRLANGNPVRVIEDGRTCLKLEPGDGVMLGFDRSKFNATGTLTIVAKGTRLQLTDGEPYYHYRGRIYFNSTEEFITKTVSINSASYSIGDEIGLEGEVSTLYIDSITLNTSPSIESLQGASIASTVASFTKDEYGILNRAVARGVFSLPFSPDTVSPPFTIIARCRLDHDGSDATYGSNIFDFNGNVNGYTNSMGMGLKKYGDNTHVAFDFAFWDGNIGSYRQAGNPVVADTSVYYPKDRWITVALTADEDGNIKYYAPSKIVDVSGDKYPAYNWIDCTGPWTSLKICDDSIELSYFSLHDSILPEEDIISIVNANYVDI